MYENYWKLSTKPFENTPDPAFVYYSKKHEEAFVRLMYAIREAKGAAMLSGGYGTGKTLLSRVIINELIKSKNYEVALITHPQLSSRQFLQEFIYQLNNSQVKGDKPVLLHSLQDIIYKNFKENKRTVIIIDEAQIIQDKKTFEELRLLLNFQLNNKFLLTMVLIGQPELVKKINDIPQLEQRIGVKYHLGGLDKNETIEYIQHRLSVAGRKEPVFTEPALSLVSEYSCGFPRKINNICDIALLIGFGQKAEIIGDELIKRLIGDLTKKVEAHAEVI